VISGLGMVATVTGDLDAAERHLAEARDIFRRAGDRWGLASTLWRIADLAVVKADLERAEAALQEASSVLEPTHRDRWIANTLSGLAEVALLRGDVERASAYFDEARERYAARDDALGISSIDERLAALAK
jgi:tetratricopeptide (TPR) repeat protein